MTPIDLQTGFILLTGVTAIAAVIVIFCRHDNKLAAHDKRFQALEDRVAMLEIPEIVQQGEQRRLVTQAMLRKANGYGGQDTEGRA
jgi:hypothetical protein